MRISKYIIIALITILSGCTGEKLPIISGSVAYDGNKGWVYLRVYEDPITPIKDAECIMDSFFRIDYQDSIEAYYREVSTIVPHSHHLISITREGYEAIIGTTTVPSNFSIMNINTSITTGDSLYVSWGLDDNQATPEEWYITLTHNNSQYFTTSLNVNTTSLTIDGSNFPAPGTYILSIYGIIYGGLENTDTQSTFAGINQKKITINVRSEK